MKTKSRESSIRAGLFGRRILPAFFLAALCVLVTGCPHNDYTVELKPTAHGMERTLTFYRLDGSDSNGVPNYQEFSSNELVAITHIYPAGAVTEDGQRHIAKSEFAGAMPGDVGGAGGYTNYVTSLGESGIYIERFRGNDDVAGKTLKQYRAADQLADLVVGWSKGEFGHERGYKKLRAFLDGDFRNDLKNAGQYFQLGTVNDLANTNAPEEYAARFFQYLIERGYLKLSDVASIPGLPGGNESEPALMQLMQKLVAEKMEIPAGGPLPKSLSILTNEAALQKSWEGYLAKSDRYRAQHKAWEEMVKANPKLEEPKPAEAADELVMNLLGISSEFGGEADHLTVKLALKHAPDHSNGKWQNGRVVWEADLPVSRLLPVVCYASWNNPDETFQKAHFGSVLFTGDELSKYDLWRNGLGAEDGQRWDAFVAGLQPGDGLKGKIETFQAAKSGGDPLYAGCKLLIGVLPKAQ
ncbi:MAG TPA: hypothetical protein VG347_09015 [Verrucomicrobiae bacterium]|nr:hypothetical protein [Verrucomicrobiae bacterium]